VTSREPGRRLPEVNLFLRQPGPAEEGGSRRRYVESALVAVVIVIWAGVGVGIASLLGWHPTLGP
jgi:hypothetical protein